MRSILQIIEKELADVKGPSLQCGVYKFKFVQLKILQYDFSFEKFKKGSQ